MHAGKIVFVLIDRAPCPILLRVHFLTRRISTRRAILLLSANLAVRPVHLFFPTKEAFVKK